MHKMKTFTLILLGPLLLVGLSGLRESFGAADSGLTRTHSGGGVTVKVTYLNPQDTDNAQFQVALDTHSVNLDSYDLKNLSLLRDDAGQSYPPTQVENKGSGHHREFTLIFPKPSAGTKRLEFVIQDIAKVEERSFRWDLSQ